MKGYRLPEPTRWADAVASERPAFVRYTANQPNSGKLRIISVFENSTCYKTQFICVWSAWQAGSMSLLWPAYANACTQLRRILSANRLRRWADLPPHSRSHLGNADRQRCKSKFRQQLEKFEEAIPSADDFDLYGVYPAIDACVALSELVHSRLSGETLEHAVEVSKTSITTVAMLEMTQAGREMSDEELKENPAVEQEWDIQWEIFRLLAECEERDIELIKGLRADLREAGESNIGIIFQQ